MDLISLLAAVQVNALLMMLALVVVGCIRARSGLQAWQLRLLAHRDAAEQALVRLAPLDPLIGLLNRREWTSRAGHSLDTADALRGRRLVIRAGAHIWPALRV